MWVCTDLLVGELEAKLLNTALDGVPAGQTVTDGDVASETEVLGLEDLVGRGVVKDGLGVDTSLVGESAVAATKDLAPRSALRKSRNLRDRVHEGDVNLHSLRDKVLNLTEHGQVVLGLDVLRVRGVQARNETAEGGDTDTLTDTEDGGVDVGGTSLERSVRVGNGCIYAVRQKYRCR